MKQEMPHAKEIEAVRGAEENRIDDAATAATGRESAAQTEAALTSDAEIEALIGNAGALF